MYFTGEMVYPWMLDDVAPLRQYKDAADIIARKADWPALYNTHALQEVNVPVATATYVEVREQNGTSCVLLYHMTVPLKREFL